MTIEERVEDIFDGDEIMWLGVDRARLSKRIRKALISALLSDREACAQIAEEENERCESAADAIADKPFATIHESTGHEMAAKAARRIMLKIRARSTADVSDAEGEEE